MLSGVVVTETVAEIIFRMENAETLERAKSWQLWSYASMVCIMIQSFWYKENMSRERKTLESREAIENTVGMADE